MLAICQYASGQKKGPPASAEYYPKIRFIVQAPSLVPSLVREGDWERLQNFVTNWKRSDIPNDELIFSIIVLSAVENRKLTVFQLPCDYLYFLEDYARQLKKIDEHAARFRYYVKVSEKYSYDATEDATKLLDFTRAWARRLILERRLDKTESFLCHVLAGDIPEPYSYFQQNRSDLATLDLFQRNIDAHNNNYFAARRDESIVTVGIMTGIWMPTRKLKILGDHPSVGLLLGARDKVNEYDIVWAFRFLHPTPGMYTYVRNDTSYASDYYDGGYIGFDYTRYFLRKTHFEFGAVLAAAYDYFSVVNGFDTQEHPLPINIGSFDLNGGCRIKYFFRRSGFLGLVAKYHLIHYSNEGGTDLSGNAFTIDLVYGSH